MRSLRSHKGVPKPFSSILVFCKNGLKVFWPMSESLNEASRKKQVICVPQPNSGSSPPVAFMTSAIRAMDLLWNFAYGTETG